MRSIIQLAGRVRRHRTGTVPSPNIALLDCNLKALENPQGAAFTRPGFETSLFMLQTHKLNDLLRHEEIEHIDATARIIQAKPLQVRQCLSDLEHARMGGVMRTLADDDLPEELQGAEPTVRRWWQTLSHLTANEQRKKRFRYDPQGREEFVLLPTAEEDDFGFFTLSDEGLKQSHDNRFVALTLPEHPHISVWAVRPYMVELMALADVKDQPMSHLAERFGALGLPKGQGDQIWTWHELLGYRRCLKD